MENVQIGSVEQATLVVGVLAMATEDENGISGDSQVIRIKGILQQDWGTGNQCCAGGNSDEIHIGQIIASKYKSITSSYQIVSFWCTSLTHHVWLSYISVGFGEDAVE